MKLLRMALKNFRGYKNADIRFDDQMTTIIGKNDIGKSTIVDALEIFFNNSTVKIDPDDAYINGDPKEVKITCEFSDIPEEIIIDESQKTNLRDEYLVNENGNLEIEKLYDLSGKKPKVSVYALANYPDNPELKDILYLDCIIKVTTQKM
ncbi:MAG: AAA family ATPase [Lacticaseibacillus paracasei]